MIPQAQARRILQILALGVMTHGITQTITFSVLPAIGREIGLREIQIGGIISISATVFVVCARQWGRLSDRIGRKPVLITGLSGSVLGCLLLATLFGLGLSGTMTGVALFLAILAARAGQALIMSATHPSATAYVADITAPVRRTAGMGKIGAAMSLGSVMGPAIAGLLAGISLLLPIYSGAGFAAIAVLVVWRLLPPSPLLQQHQVNQRLSSRDRRLLPYLTVGVIVFLGFSVIQQTLAFRLQDTLSLDAKATARYYGFMMMISAAVSLATQTLLVPRLSGHPVWLLRLGAPLLLCCLLLLILGKATALVAVSMVFLGLGLGCTGPGFSACVSLAVNPEEQGGAAGIAASVPGLGFILGPVVGTGLYQANPLLPYVVTALVLVPGCVLAFRLRTPRAKHDLA